MFLRAAHGDVLQLRTVVVDLVCLDEPTDIESACKALWNVQQDHALLVALESMNGTRRHQIPEALVLEKSAHQLCLRGVRRAYAETVLVLHESGLAEMPAQVPRKQRVHQ